MKKEVDYDYKIPHQGIDKNEVLEKLKSFREDDPDWKNGRTFSLVYYLGEEYNNFLKKAHNTYFSENGLNPMAFKSLKQMEREVVRMSVNMLGGDLNAVGTMTSGGTESILMATKTYRDMARKKKPWITKPNMVLPASAHVAFDKAGKYFDVELIHVPLAGDYRVDMKAMKKAMNRNTIMLVGSAPQYPHGVIDPISEIAAIGKKKGIPVHVDGCFGGFLLPWVEKFDATIPKFDFRVDGVTSISADIHKYGYGAKGASVILYKDMNYMQHQFFVTTNWPGGVYAGPSMAGTRPGGPIAAAWAAMMSMGEDGYVEQAKKIVGTVNRFKEAIQAIPELEILGDPKMSALAYRSINPSEISIYAVADILSERGWVIDRQQSPECVHASITPAHGPIIDEFIDDLKEAIAIVKANPKLASSGQAAMYGMVAKIPFKSMIQKQVLNIMKDMYSAESKSPDEKTGEVENFSDLIEKMGTSVLEVKRQLNVLALNIKKKLF